MRFNQRRLRERNIYEIVLREVLGNGTLRFKEQVSYVRLLHQLAAYEILLLIWASSPYGSGTWDWADWDQEDTVYSLAQKIAQNPGQLNKTINYVDRVVDAAEHFSLVRRVKAPSGNMKLLRAAPKLDELMTKFAFRAGGLESSVAGDQNG